MSYPTYARLISKHSLKPRTQYFHNSTVRNSSSQSSHLQVKFSIFLEKSCTEIDLLKKLHASIFCNGFANNSFLGSKLVNLYAKFESLPESRLVFDRIINDRVSLWNSILVGYFRTGHFHEVLYRFSCLRRRSNVGLDGYAITFCLKSCVELGCFGFGTCVHGDCVKYGLCSDRFVGSSLIGLYAKNGEIENVYKVFDEITDRDVVVYTSLITVCARIGNLGAYDAFRIARDMQREDLGPNRVTLVSLLQASAQVESLEGGCSIHGYAIRRDIGSEDEVFQTSLMDMYAKCGVLKTATHIFRKMRKKSVGSWNAAIGGYLQTGQPFEALNIFCLMMKEKCDTDLITLANIVLCCAHLECLREGKSIHGYVIRNGIQLDRIAITSLIDMYFKCNNLIMARRLFNLMEERDVICFNVMMAGYIQNGAAREAIKVFHEMVEYPNLGTVLSLLSISSNLKEIKQGKSVHGYVLKLGLDSNTEISNQIIYMYAKCDCLEYASEVFRRIRYKDLVSWTSMMMGYVSHDHADRAVALFRLMQREHIKPDSITLTSLIQAFAQIGCLGFAKEVHSYIYRSLMEKEIQVINSLIRTYAQCGNINMARALFENTGKKCLTSWNTIIAAYGIHGDCIEIFKLLEKMKKAKVLPDEITFTSLLSACSHSGLVEEGLHIFGSMAEHYSITPNQEHYNCILDMLSRAGRLEEAYEVLKCLPKTKNASALSSLLAACRFHGETDMGEDLAKQLLDTGPKNSSAFVSVSNLYAEGGKWEEVVRIRAMSEGSSLKWSHGYSLIDLEKRSV